MDVSARNAMVNAQYAIRTYGQKLSSAFVMNVTSARTEGVVSSVDLLVFLMLITALSAHDSKKTAMDAPRL